MKAILLTDEELQKFKHELLAGVEEIVTKKLTPQKKLLKNKDVRKILNISASTLQTLRINGTLPYSKIGGTLYYNYEDVIRVFEDNLHTRNGKAKPSKPYSISNNKKEVHNG